MEIVLVLGMQETYPRGSRKIASEDVVLDLKHNSESVFDVLISHDYLSPLLLSEISGVYLDLPGCKKHPDTLAADLSQASWDLKML